MAGTIWEQTSWSIVDGERPVPHQWESDVDWRTQRFVRGRFCTIVRKQDFLSNVPAYGDKKTRHELWFLFGIRMVAAEALVNPFSRWYRSHSELT